MYLVILVLQYVFAIISEIDGLLPLIQLGKRKHCFGGCCTFSDSQTQADFQLWFKGRLCYWSGAKGLLFVISCMKYTC